MAGPVLTVLVYDVASDKRRGRIHKLLRQYGVAVQASAFEARLTPAERAALLRQIRGMIDDQEDSFIAYVVTHDQEERITAIGRPRPEAEAPKYFVV